MCVSINFKNVLAIVTPLSNMIWPLDIWNFVRKVFICVRFWICHSFQSKLYTLNVYVHEKDNKTAWRVKSNRSCWLWSTATIRIREKWQRDKEPLTVYTLRTYCTHSRLFDYYYTQNVVNCYKDHRLCECALSLSLFVLFSGLLRLYIHLAFYVAIVISYRAESNFDQKYFTQKWMKWHDDTVSLWVGFTIVNITKHLLVSNR